jgi:4-methylaminobutanoate oxidase (formaldehyde-forming)
MLPRSADAVVVGAGGFGTSIAFHLAAGGADVVLVDRSAAVTETSAMAAGIAMQVHPTEAASRLAIASLAALVDLRPLTGRALAYHQAGSIKVARTEAHARIIRDEIAFGRRLGVAIDPLEPAEAMRLAPWLRCDDATALSIVRDDLHFEPADLPRLYLAAGRDRGVRICEGVRVAALTVTDGEVTGVGTGAGPIRAPIVVLAAGAWTAPLAAAAGVPLPVVAVRHELFVTGPVAGIDEATPHVRVMDANAYARPYHGGLMAGCYETTPVEVDVAAAGGGLPAGLASPPAALADRLATVATVIPALADARAVEVRAGVPTMSPDGTFVVDRLPGVRGAYAVTGDNVMGLHVTPAVGALLASWIARGEQPALLTPFGLDRFAGRDPAALRTAALAQYATKYQHLDEPVSA